MLRVWIEPPVIAAIASGLRKFRLLNVYVWFIYGTSRPRQLND